MIFTIALILSCLVAINFLMLIFSCNKSAKKTEEKQINAIKKAPSPTLVSNQLSRRQLAATGS